MKSKAPINAADYVTSGEQPFTAQTGVSAVGEKESGRRSVRAEGRRAPKPSLEELMAELEELVGLGTVKREVKISRISSKCASCARKTACRTAQ